MVVNISIFIMKNKSRSNFRVKRTAVIGRSCHKCCFCCDKHNFVATNILSQQAYFWTYLLSWQKYACHDKYLSQQKFCRDKHTFVATKDTPKIILVAASANDSIPWHCQNVCQSVCVGPVTSESAADCSRRSERWCWWRYACLRG